MSEYLPNSHKSKEEAAETTRKKRVEKVVSGRARTKKNEKRRLMNLFVSEDASNVKSYVFIDVLVPAIKKAISDIVTDGISMILYGDSSASKKKNSAGKVSYRSYYDDRPSSRDRETTRSRFVQDDLIFDTRGEAEAVRSGMSEVIERYGHVTIADMYDLADLTAPHTANRYGWVSMRNSEVVRVHDGYVLRMPKAMVID